MFSRDLITYTIIVIACVALIILVSSQNYGKNRTIHEMYLSDYPQQVSPGEDISFSIMITNSASREIQYIAAILIDGEEKQQHSVTLPIITKKEEQFTIGQNFTSGEKHKIEIRLYDEQQDPGSYGSLEHPYYVFFNVDVV